MTDNTARLEPLEGEKSVHLLQAKADGTLVDSTVDLTVDLPQGADDVLIGLLDASRRVFFDTSNVWEWLELIAWCGFLVLLLAIGAVVVWRLWNKDIDLTHLVSEKDGKASLSRFQALIFTFIFMIAVMLIVIRTGQFPTDIHVSVLAILGGSLGTYLISKGLQRRSDVERRIAAATGPQLRFLAPQDDDATLPIKWADLKGLISGPSKFTLTANTAGSDRFTVVAVAVHTVQLTLRATMPAEAELSGTVRYLDSEGKQEEQAFTDQVTITTPAKRISEVAVSFSGKDAGTIVTLEVMTG